MSVDSIPDFPKLDNTTIINNITLGKYQLKQALSYIKDNLSDSGKYSIELYKDKTNTFDNNTFLLKTRLQSRHSSSTKYNSFINYSTNSSDHNAIKDWICTYKSGKKTVGCCSHVASVIYYLSNARYSTAKTERFSIKTIFPDNPIIESSDEESDSTIIDSENTDTDVYDIDSDEEQPAMSPTNRIYPDLLTLEPILE
jgi:hypothetical protein